MIENTVTSKNIVKKIFPHKSMQNGILKDVFAEIKTHVNDNVDAVNLINSKYIESLDVTTKTTNNILSELRAVASSYADLAAASGSTNSSFDILFGENPVKSSHQMVYSKDSGIIKINGEYVDLLVPVSVSHSTSAGSIGTSDRRSDYLYDDLESIFGATSHVQFENIGSPLLTTIHVDLGKEYPLNNLSFDMINLGIGFPEVTSIRGHKSDGTYEDAIIDLSNSNSIDLDKYSFTDNRIFIDFKELRASRVSITFSQNKSFEINENQERFAFGINKLRMGFVSSFESGNIVFGPIATTSQILKAAVYADAFRDAGNAIRYSISFDNSTWIDISNAKDLFPENPKIININNIEDDSFNTDNPVKEIFLRVAMSSVDASYINISDLDVEKVIATLSPSERLITTDGSTQNNTSVFEYSRNRFGASSLFEQGDTVVISDHIISASLNEDYIPLSIGEIEGCIDISKESVVAENSNLKISNKKEKSFVIPGETGVCRPRNSFDPFAIKTYSRSSVINSTINAETLNNKISSDSVLYGLKPSCEAGTLTIALSNGTSARINLSDGFVLSAHNLIFRVPEDVSSAVVYINGHKKLGTVNTTTVSESNCLSLYSLLGISVPVIQNRTYSYTFPVEKLSDTEFSIVNGSIYFGSYFKGSVSNCSFVREEEISNSPISGPMFGVRQVISKNKQIKASYSLDGYSFKKVIKLKHTDIMKGTLSFSITNASTNAFVKEVKFIDGISEFNSSAVSTEISVTGSGIVLGVSAQDTNGQESIEFSGKIDLFRNRVYTTEELIESGDWMLDSGIIYFPEGVIDNFSIGATTITYSVAPKSPAGLYSVDYINGIVYTNIGADDKTVVSYNYSSIYSSYEGLTKLDKSDTIIRPSSVEIIKEIPANRTKYLVMTENDISNNNTYAASPFITNLKLNLITEENFL